LISCSDTLTPPPPRMVIRRHLKLLRMQAAGKRVFRG
jgi:hypothetical protein